MQCIDNVALLVVFTVANIQKNAFLAINEVNRLLRRYCRARFT